MFTASVRGGGARVVMGLMEGVHGDEWRGVIRGLDDQRGREL